jgi:hypothetical protein
MKRFAIFFLALATGFSQVPRPTPKDLEKLADFMLKHKIRGGNGIKLAFKEKWPHPQDPLEIYFPKDAHNNYHIYYSNTNPNIHVPFVMVSVRPDSDPKGLHEISIIDSEMDGVVDRAIGPQGTVCSVKNEGTQGPCSSFQAEFNQAIQAFLKIVATQSQSQNSQ